MEAVGGKGINLEEQPREIEVRSGVIVLAVGLNTYPPRTANTASGCSRR